MTFRDMLPRGQRDAASIRWCHVISVAAI